MSLEKKFLVERNKKSLLQDLIIDHLKFYYLMKLQAPWMKKVKMKLLTVFRKLLNDKTVIFITHKKNYSKLFDRVINLDDQL